MRCRDLVKNLTKNVSFATRADECARGARRGVARGQSKSNDGKSSKDKGVVGPWLRKFRPVSAKFGLAARLGLALLHDRG